MNGDLQLPAEVVLSSESVLHIEQVPYRNLPFRISQIADGGVVASYEFESGDNPYEKLYVYALHGAFAVFLFELSKLIVLDLQELEVIEERTLDRQRDVPGDFRIARFHPCGESVVLETELSLVAISGDGFTQVISEHSYPRTVVTEVNENSAKVRDGDRDLWIHWASN